VIPLFVQIAATLSARLFTSSREAARIGIAVMLLFTGASHFSGLSHDMAGMIPPPLTGSLALIYLTGLLEIAGALGILTRRLKTAAAWSLAALLVALFPANIYAALAGVTLGGQPVTPLWIRGPLQLFWFVTLLWVARPSVSLRQTGPLRKRNEWLVHRDGVM
jgi:uncharacterized membrane protein